MQHSVTEELIAKVSPAEAWQRMSDLGKAHYYVPGVTGTRLDTTSTRGVGTSRTVFRQGQAPLEETVTEWREGSGFVLKLHRGGRTIAPFAQAEFAYSLSAVDGEHTRLRLELRYDLGSWFTRFAHSLVLRAVLRANLRRTARNMRRYYETGLPVGPDAVKDA